MKAIERSTLAMVPAGRSAKRDKECSSEKIKKPLSIQSIILTAFAVLVLIGCGAALAQPPAKQRTDPAVARVGNGFVANTAKVNGTTLYFIRGGAGPALILLHGFPQDWYEFHHVMPRLAKMFTVIAVDLRGIGRSAATAGGYDAVNVAEDLFRLTKQLKLEQVYIAGHDVGGSVAYAFLRLHPQALRGVMILETPVPGLEPWEEIKANPKLWHIGFHQTPGLPEKLLAGRQPKRLVQATSGQPWAWVADAGWRLKWLKWQKGDS